MEIKIRCLFTSFLMALRSEIWQVINQERGVVVCPIMFFMILFCQEHTVSQWASEFVNKVDFAKLFFLYGEVLIMPDDPLCFV